MSELDPFATGRTLLIDGDILLYRPCCVFNEDDDHSRMMIARTVKNQISNMLREAECDDYHFFVTTKFNFRDQLVDDYKANRKDVDRPVNLSWAKKWAIQNISCIYHKGLEADDLLGIYTTDDTIIWSLDKDLRQIEGMHLDEETRKVYTVDAIGRIVDKGKKIHFEGMIGFYYQCLIGDTTDHIVGCGKRLEQVYKSGKKAGQSYMKRNGVGPKAAFKLLIGQAINNEPQNILKGCLVVLASEYRKIHGDDWKEALETQANLLWMVREQHGEVIRRWTYDGREEYFDLVGGKILENYTPSKDPDGDK